MPYQTEVNRANPSCLLFLLDQSQSMSGSFPAMPGQTKADGVADAINRILHTLIVWCTRKAGVVDDYFHVGVLGYGGKDARPAFGGNLANRTLVTLSELQKNPLRVEQRTRKVPDGAGGLVDQPLEFPIWFEPRHGGETPMCQALEQAWQVLSDFLTQSPDCYPPIVLNITHGHASDGDSEAYAQIVRDLASTDGNVLLFNLHLSPRQATPILFPDRPEGLASTAAQTLFRMSSIVPPNMRGWLQGEGLPVTEDTRGFVFDAGSDGMHVPSLSGERDHPNSPDPDRMRKGTHDAAVDRFSHLLICGAPSCLRAGGKALSELATDAILGPLSTAQIDRPRSLAPVAMPPLPADFPPDSVSGRTDSPAQRGPTKSATRRFRPFALRAGGLILLLLTVGVLSASFFRKPAPQPQQEGTRADTTQTVAKLVTLLQPSNGGGRAAAADALGDMGPAAKAAVPDLLELVADREESVRGAATAALGKIDKDWARSEAAARAVPGLVKLLTHPEAPVREAAADALGSMPPAAAAAVPDLIKMRTASQQTLRSRKASGESTAATRALAARVLARIAPRAVPELIVFLSHSDRNVRMGVAAALGDVGPGAARAVPELTKLRADREQVVRAAATAALGKIDKDWARPKAAAAVPDLPRPEKEKVVLDAKVLQGTWAIERQQRVLPSGQVSTTTSRKVRRIRIEGDRLSFVAEGERVSTAYTFSVDNTKTPHWFDAVQEKKPTARMRGLISLEGDTLKLVYLFASSGKVERPASITEPPSGSNILVLKRP